MRFKPAHPGRHLATKETTFLGMNSTQGKADVNQETEKTKPNSESTTGHFGHYYLWVFQT